jgi:hypothetical protein
MKKLYRKDYQGEYVITGGDRKRGQVLYDREWVPNTINNHNTGHAVVLGNGPSRKDLNPYTEMYYQHMGGFNANKKLTVYGCNSVFKEAKVHFLVVNHPEVARQTVTSGYADNNVVLTGRGNIELFPNKFHLVPYGVKMNAGAIAAYLAAFDGHKNVYLVGVDLDNYPRGANSVFHGTPGYPAGTKPINYQRWIREYKEVFETYNDVKFIRVSRGESSPIPEEWINLPNVEQMPYDRWKKIIDLGVQGAG